MTTYRPYQEDGVRALYGLLREHRRVIGVAPTGAGKTVIAQLIAEHAAYRGVRLYFGVHRRNLVTQTYQRFTAVGLRTGVIMAGDKRLDPDAPIQVFSADTMVRRDVAAPTVLLLDEVHNLAKYQRLIDRWPNALVLGLTATPVGPLDRVFTALHVIALPSFLLANGYITDIEAWGLVRPDLSSVATRGDDFEQDGAERVVMEAVEDVVSAWIRRGQDKPTLAFAQSVKHSLALRDAFRREGIAAEHVDAETPEADRTRIFGGFVDGSVRVVLNYDIISEGADFPDCGCVVLARATKSVRVFLQQIGRGLRPASGKERCIVLDCAGNIERMWWPLDDVPWELGQSGVAVRKKMAKDAIKTCEECYRTWRAADGPKCPYCGWVKPAKEIRIKARGRETKRIERKVRTTNPIHVLELQKLVEAARRRGHKPTAALFPFRVRFNRFPTAEERKAAGL